MNACFRLLAAAAVLLATAQATLGQSSTLLPNTIGSVVEADVLERLARQRGDALIPTCRFEAARCGYIDRDGNTVIAPQFDWADRFVADRALVGSGGKYGAIDPTGHFAIAPTYDSISKFDRGLALVLVENRLGVIDQNGQSVVPAEHGTIIPIADDVFLVAEPPYARPDLQPDWLISRSTYAYGKRWGIVASGGRWVVRPTFAQVQLASNRLDGLFWAASPFYGITRWQLVGQDGAFLGNELFDHVQLFQPDQDRAVVQRDNRWGALDSKGHVAIPLKFDWLGYFRDGWAPYRLAGREGQIDKDGNVLSDATDQPRISGDADVGSVVDGKPLYIDRARTTLLGTDHPICADGRHLRFEQGRWTIVTADNRPAPDVSFQYVHLMCDGPSVVKRDGKWGFIAADGKLLADRYFDHANGFHNGIAAIVDSGLWSLMAEDGSVLLGPLKLARGVVTSGSGEYSMEFEEGYRKLDKALIAELARNPDSLTHRLAPRWPWSEGLAGQFDDKTGKWGFIGPMKNFAIAPQFDAVSPFNKGATWAAIPDRREWCVIDKTGQIKPGTQCQCNQPLVILEHYSRPSNVACYDDGVRIVGGEPPLRGTAN